MDFSQLHVTQHYEETPLGGIKTYTYRWEGKSPYILISRPFLFDLVGVGGLIDPLNIGQYKLLQVEERYEMDGWLYVRADKFGPLRIWMYEAKRTSYRSSA